MALATERMRRPGLGGVRHRHVVGENANAVAALFATLFVPAILGLALPNLRRNTRHPGIGAGTLARGPTMESPDHSGLCGDSDRGSDDDFFRGDEPASAQRADRCGLDKFALVAGGGSGGKLDLFAIAPLTKNSGRCRKRLAPLGARV